LQRKILNQNNIEISLAFEFDTNTIWLYKHNYYLKQKYIKIERNKSIKDGAEREQWYFKTKIK